MQQGSGDNTQQRHLGSRVLHVMARWAANPTLALGVVTVVGLWVLYSAVFGFPARLETIFQTFASATTLAMVFVIQHTQARAQEATQRKLDEILRASPEADNSLITLEEAPDNELRAATDASRDARRDARHEGSS
ncbi:MAG: low affinity iron permease family protein [Cellulomonas sp.]